MQKKHWNLLLGVVFFFSGLGYLMTGESLLLGFLGFCVACIGIWKTGDYLKESMGVEK
ncbi:hypothetical protein ACFL48_04280 [Pseudomonadota bacterium]